MILLTGGAGYIGSHACVALLEAGHDVVILDNLCNSRRIAVERVAQICGRAPEFVEGDIRDRKLLDRLFAERPVRGVMHFAGLKGMALT